MDYGEVVGLAELARKYGLFPDRPLEKLLRASLFFPELEQYAAEYINFLVLNHISSGYRANL